MKKVTISHDIHIIGYGMLKEGTILNVIRDNIRYVYADLNGCEVRLSRKHDCRLRQRNKTIRKESEV